MKLVLSKNVEGINKETGKRCLYAERGDVLPVIIADEQKGTKFYWCEKSSMFIPVLMSQVLTTINENDKSDNDEEYPMESAFSDLE